MSDERRAKPPAAAEAAAGERTAVPAAESDLRTAAELRSAERPGAVVGRYKLLEKIGEGGFGVVYMAEQQDPIRRRVALKIIKLGMDTAAVVARFEAERQALALMDHPHIAHVLHSGATEAGRPYFVMELVRGLPITEYCDRNHLDTRQRLELFATVCNAVQHAHQKGIIHRDLKPSNVLVTEHDGAAVPKVIDFGVAKATQHRLTEKTMFTQYGQVIGTPAYMSPEQAELSGLDIDTRSDIYSLGVLLYELLTGSTPLDQARLRSAGYVEMQRMICEEEPPRPSLRLSTSGAALVTICAHRNTEASRLVRLLRSDLDWIAIKALEKDRTRRYESANGLAVDVRRYLNDEPIVARPPSTGYRLRKLAGRNKSLLATATLFAGILVLATVVSTVQAFRALRAEARATAERNRAVFRFTALASATGAENARYFSDFATLTFNDAMMTGDWQRAEQQLETAAELLGDLQPRWWQTNWWIIGPFDGEFESAAAAENSLDPLQPVPALEPADPRQWIACAAHDAGFLDVGRILIENGSSPQAYEFASTYAQVRVYSARELPVAISSHADDWLRFWLNGELMSQRTKALLIPARLQAGWNTILVKVYNEGGHKNMRLAISDAPQEIINAAVAQRQWDQARRLLADLQPRDERLFLLLSAMVARKHVEQLLATGRRDEAAELLERSRSLHRRLGAAYREDADAAQEQALWTLGHDFTWRPLELLDMQSAAGATLVAQADGSILVSGVNPDRDTYTVVAEADLDAVRHLRIETLTDASFYEHGSGRCPYSGNFHLSEVEVHALQAGAEPGPAPLALVRAVTEFSQKIQPISHILDKDPATYWDMWPRQTEPHAVYVAFDEPLHGSGRAKLRIMLHCQDPKYAKHTLGRFRLSVSGDELPMAAR